MRSPGSQDQGRTGPELPHTEVGDELPFAEGPERGAVVFRAGMTMDDIEKEAIRAVLREVEGNRRNAAKSLGIGERTLYRKIQKYAIEE